MPIDSLGDHSIPEQTNPSSLEGSTRQEMLGEASMLASFLVDQGNIKHVGIAGSLARGKENPSDVDFVIFVDNSTAKACHREKMRLLREKSPHRVNLSKFLTVDDEQWNWFVMAISGCKHRFDIQVISDNPDEEYLTMMAKDNIDPNFIKNLSNDVLLYDQAEDQFKQAQVFTQEQHELMDQASFNRLKDVLSNPDDRYYDTIAKSHSHLKRIGKTDDEKPQTRIFDIREKTVIDETRRKQYLDLIKAFDENPNSLELFNRVVQFAKSESVVDDGSGVYYFEDLTQENLYEQLPLVELIQIGQRLRSAQTRDARYEILMEKNSRGELWYDIILGHVNDKMFQPVIDRLGSLDQIFTRGLNIGCRTGNSLKLIAPYCVSAVGVDNLDIALQAAKQNDLPDNVSLVKSNGVLLPLDNESCDLVVSNWLTSNLNSQEVNQYVTEVVRVLNQGGRYFDTIITIQGGSVIPRFEEDYLSSAKSVLVCLLNRICSNTKDVETSESTIKVLLEKFSDSGVSMQFSGFDHMDIGVLEFRKN